MLWVTLDELAAPPSAVFGILVFQRHEAGIRLLPDAAAQAAADI